jgi:ABC-2 type transport system permease protein
MSMLTLPEVRGSIRRIRALVIKESYQIVYDPSSILISVVLPVMLLFLYAFGVSLDLNTVNIGLVLEDTSPDARSFAASITGSPYFNARVVRDRRELTSALLAGEIRGFVVIPSYFSAFRHEASANALDPQRQIVYYPEVRQAPIQIITDGGEPNTANFVQNYVAQAWSKWLIQEKMEGKISGLPRINLQPRYWFNETLESRYFLLPGSLAIIMTLIGTTLTALVIAREWERGTMEALMATPVHINEILIAKLISYFAMGMVSMTCCVVLTVFVYGVPFRGSVIALAVVTAGFLFPALGIGLLISTATKNQLAASQAAQIAGFLPAYILSGYIFEIGSMPKIIQLTTYIVPARYFVKSLLSLFLVGNVWCVLIEATTIMVVVGLIIFGATSRLIVKRLD